MPISDGAWLNSRNELPALRRQRRSHSSVNQIREIRASWFDERDVETEHEAANETAADERAGIGRQQINHRAISFAYC